MRKLPRLVFVLLIGTATAIFCTLLLSPGFLATDRRPSASRKEQMSIKEEKEENRRSVSGIELSDARQQFARRVSLDAHLLGRGFTDEQVKYCTILCIADSILYPLLAELISSFPSLFQYYEKGITIIIIYFII